MNRISQADMVDAKPDTRWREQVKLSVAWQQLSEMFFLGAISV
jgi:hypothetical protein